jgi:hypothetical protein
MSRLTRRVTQTMTTQATTKIAIAHSNPLVVDPPEPGFIIRTALSVY